jgi:hypothetical protein
VYVDGGTASINAISKIHNNTSYGVYNSTVSTTSAEGNYWGSNSGPTYSGNLGGIGDRISDHVDYASFVGTTTLHFIILDSSYSCPSSTCASVRNNTILLDASTTIFATELGAASTTWNSFGKVFVTAATSTTANVDINDMDYSDSAIKGEWNHNSSFPDSLWLNKYFLTSQTFGEVQNTITHELGHAMGLDHSYTGNVMYFNQSPQTTLGPQDISDFNYLWP